MTFSRYQCYPLYKINYSVGSRDSNKHNVDVEIYEQSRRCFPPFRWMPTGYYGNTLVEKRIKWPFYAETVFEAMEASASASPSASVEEKRDEKANTKCLSLIDQLNFLSDLGFDDLDKNIENLRKHEFDLDKCVDYLLKLKA